MRPGRWAPRMLVIGLLLAACSPQASEVLRSPAAPSPRLSRIDAMIADIQSFWSRQYPGLYGEPYVPVPPGRVYAAGRPGVVLPTCQGQVMDEPQWHGNAFYCFEDNYVAYDARPGGLIQTLVDAFGVYAVGVVFAHEWGHAIQDRAGNEDAPVVLAELQADCFSGAWVAHVVAGEGPGIAIHANDLDSVLAALLAAGDAPGSLASSPSAHGSGFDRVSSFQEGYRNGAQACTGYLDTPPFVTEIPFSGAREAQTRGNLAAPKVLPSTVDMLNHFFNRVEPDIYRPVPLGRVLAFDPESPEPVPACGGIAYEKAALTNSVALCQADRFVVVDVMYLQRIYEEIGDFGVATLVAVPWAGYVLELKGTATSDTERARAADCATGGFAAAMVLGRLRSPTLGGRVVASPGDLDEAIAAFLEADRVAPGAAGSAFERVDAFRQGFFDGYASCELSAPAFPPNSPVIPSTVPSTP